MAFLVVAAMRAATDVAVAGGFMLPADADEWMQRVAGSPIGAQPGS